MPAVQSASTIALTLISIRRCGKFSIIDNLLWIRHPVKHQFSVDSLLW